jgi:hypothetical protein
MLTRQEINEIKGYHAVIESAKESVAGIIADSMQRTLKERIQKAYQWHIANGTKIEKRGKENENKV